MKKRNKKNWFWKLLNKFPKLRLWSNFICNFIYCIGVIVLIFSILFAAFVILLILMTKFKFLEFLKNDIAKSIVFGVFSLIASPILCWGIKNKKEMQQNIFLNNIIFFEKLTQLLFRIYICASNGKNVPIDKLLKFFKKNVGKFYVIIPNKILENISLLIRECNEYDTQDFENIKYFANECIERIGRFSNKGRFTYFNLNFVDKKSIN